MNSLDSLRNQKSLNIVSGTVAPKHVDLKQPQVPVLLAVQPFGEAGAEAVPVAYDGLTLVPDPLLAVLRIPPAMHTRESRVNKSVEPREAKTLHTRIG